VFQGRVDLFTDCLQSPPFSLRLGTSFRVNEVVAVLPLSLRMGQGISLSSQEYVRQSGTFRHTDAFRHNDASQASTAD
jgi:hypothetical protein